MLYKVMRVFALQLLYPAGPGGGVLPKPRGTTTCGSISLRLFYVIQGCAYRLSDSNLITCFASCLDAV